jgi:hypothetical protein
MTLDELVLQRTADWRPPDGRQMLTVSDNDLPWSATLTADRADELGCLLWEVGLRRRTPLQGGKDTLQGWAERAAERVTGLLEPLKVLEVDAQRNEALLRSEEPARRGGGLFYYEVLLQGQGAAEVRRYRGPRQDEPRREQVAFALTHEAVAKLVADLTAEQ